jgi:hypothetical protein
VGVRSPGPFASKSTVALGLAAALFVAVPLVGAGLWRAARRDEPPGAATRDDAQGCQVRRTIGEFDGASPSGVDASSAC